MEVSATVAKALLLDNDTLVRQNQFSSLDGLVTTDAGGDPHTGTPIILTAIVEFNYEHITVENQVVLKSNASSSSLLPTKGVKSMTLNVLCTPYSAGKSSLYALLFILLRTWKGPSPRGLSLDFLLVGNLSFLR